MHVIGEAPELHEAVELALALRPDVVLLNDFLPPVDSAIATTILREQGISAAILCIALKLDTALIERALQHGVNGFLEKDEINQHLGGAIRSVYQGELYLSPKARKIFADDPQE